MRRVVVACILREDTVLIAQRSPHAMHGGLWEFPGGKVEAGESDEAALIRECAEELGIQVVLATPFLTVSHTYPERSVLLSVFIVREFIGEPRALASAQCRFVSFSALKNFTFPEANSPIIVALNKLHEGL